MQEVENRGTRHRELSLRKYSGGLLDCTILVDVNVKIDGLGLLLWGLEWQSVGWVVLCAQP